MTYLQRDNEKTLGELQRDVEAVRAAMREERKSQMILELVIEKRRAALKRTLEILAPQATTQEQQDELIGILNARPPTVLLEAQIPFNPIVLALGTGRLSSVQELNACNNEFVTDDAVVALGHIIGASSHAHNLESVILGGTSVRCRGLEAIIHGAVQRRERLGNICAPFMLHALSTEIFRDTPACQAALKKLIAEVMAKYSNISIEL
jgi:hypothetical protein